MTRKTIKTNYLQTIDWLNGNIVDWVSAGQQYSLNGGQTQLAKYHFAFSFDGSITSPDGQYSFIYKRLGTKGLLLKNDEIIREINRSYYHAETYEFPAAFITFENETFLVHCPIDYCQLDFENVETGEIVTNIQGRKPSDIFHSRLSISPDNKYLMVCGWAWHPVDTVELFEIAECFKNPFLLDKSSLYPDFGTEINSASFIDNDRILIASSDEEPFDDEEPPILPQKHIAVWNFLTNEISKPIKVNGEFGNVFAINDQLAWDMFKYPKIINIQTGEIESKIEEINSGLQTSSILYGDIEKYPQICFDKASSQIAIKIDSTTIEVLSP
ncbi:MAG: hypothetical protein J0G96_07835 [Flavobacteriia bacterium]|nr:hypothetical protein [Flavobacteriia bacterium]OJX39384.1 MAG: hypothetical protein BGO87_05265 [Flavobacteriia bacterium 40-80]